MRSVAKCISLLIIFVLTAEFFAYAFVPTHPEGDIGQTTIHEKNISSSFLFSVLFEKTEEESVEGDPTRIFIIELADFSNLAHQLSFKHSPHLKYIPNQFLFNAAPSLFKLFCNYLI